MASIMDLFQQCIAPTRLLSDRSRMASRRDSTRSSSHNRTHSVPATVEKRLAQMVSLSKNKEESSTRLDTNDKHTVRIIKRSPQQLGVRNTHSPLESTSRMPRSIGRGGGHGALVDVQPELTATYEKGFAALQWNADGTGAQGLVPVRYVVV